MTHDLASTEPPSSTNARERLAPHIISLRARVRILADAARIRLADADRLDFHVRRESLRRANSRTRNNRIFGHGANAEKGGYDHLPDLAILGLEHHGPLYALWMAIAANEVTGGRGACLAHIFRCPRRLAWCESEGARIAWEWSKALDEQMTAEFEERDRVGKLSDWRKLQVSAKQHYRIALICARRGLETPRRLRRGSAYEWIKQNGGNPRFWDAPVRLPDWNG